MCHPILVPSYLHELDDANAKVGAERNPQKTEVTHYVDDLNAAPPEWKVDDVQNMATVSTVTAGSTTLGVAVGSDSSLQGPALGQRRHSSHARNVSSCVRTRRQNLLSSAKVSESAASTTSSECTATRSCRRNEPLKSTTRLDSDLLRGSSRVSRKTSWYRPHSAHASRE